MRYRRLLVLSFLVVAMIGATAVTALATNGADQFDPQIRLVKKHLEFFGDSPENVVPLGVQLRIFHRNRVRRIVGNHDGDELPFGREYLVAARKGEVIGGNAASFLTSF